MNWFINWSSLSEDVGKEKLKGISWVEKWVQIRVEVVTEVLVRIVFQTVLFMSMG